MKISHNKYQSWRNSRGEFHRLDGPAFISPRGLEIWYKNGLRHRENGPAVKDSSGREDWYYEGEKIFI